MVTESFCGNNSHFTRPARTRHSWPRTYFVLMACTLLCNTAWAQPDAGPKQNFRKLPVDEDLRRDYYSTVNPALMAGRFNPGQEPTFDKFYHKYFLARWTDPRNIANLPAFRKELRTSHLGKKNSGTQVVHDHLSALVLNFMENLIDGPFHPAVQINAMLMIGELNGVERPPTPLPEALQLMIAAVGNTDRSDAVRAAAMVGIQRHVGAGVTNQDTRRTLTTALLNVADDDLPAGIQRPGRQWILGQALETLASLGAVGNGNAVFKIMLKTTADDNLSLSTRSIAAESLGRLNYAGATGINLADAAAVLGRFVLEVCAEELDKAKDTDEPVSRQRMQQCLSAVETALEGDKEMNRPGGIASLAKTQNQRALVDGFQKNIQSMSEQIVDWEEGDDLTDAVKKLQSDLEALVNKN